MSTKYQVGPCEMVKTWYGYEAVPVGRSAGTQVGAEDYNAIFIKENGMKTIQVEMHDHEHDELIALCEQMGMDSGELMRAAFRVFYNIAMCERSSLPPSTKGEGI